VADELADRPGLAQLPVEPADTFVIPDEMETPQTHEKEVAREESPVTADPPVQLECSQRTSAPPSYIQDLFCDLVDMYNIL